MKFLCWIIGLLATGYLPAQDHPWWAQNVQWDGVSHWMSYIRFAPKYLGPNALPIPDLAGGVAPVRHSFAFDTQVHTQSGDRTLNPLLKATYAAVPGKIGFDIQFLPIEFFNTSHQLKTTRHVFHTFYHTRHATGDTYFQTYLQLLNRPRHLADVLLRIGYRFPPSNQVGAARFTDTPGYYFDLSSGIPLSPTARVHAMSGFYVWQTNDPQHAQNDAFLWGAGMTFSPGRWNLDLHIRSYLGYLKNGDDPIVGRLSASFQTNRTRWQWLIQQGLHDYSYTSLSLGFQHQW